MARQVCSAYHPHSSCIGLYLALSYPARFFHVSEAVACFFALIAQALTDSEFHLDSCFAFDLRLASADAGNGLILLLR